MTVQNRSCTVSQHYRCDADAPGDQWVEYFTREGATYRSRIDDETRVVILAAEGKAFCAGHDLRQMQGMAPDQLAHLFDRCAHLMQMIPALPQPVIAQVQGVATAAGCQLVASCDMAVAADGARFGVNGVSIGLFCATPMVALTRAIPPKAAFEMPPS